MNAPSRILTLLCLMPAVLAASAGAGVAEETRAPVATTDPDRAAFAELASPWYDVRRAAAARLAALPRAEVLAQTGVLFGAKDARVRCAAIDRVRGSVEAGRASPDEIELLVAAADDRDPTVVVHLVHALARAPQALDRVRAAAAREPGLRRLVSRALDERLLLMLEEILHFGRVPGFFDGQFAALHALDPTAYERLLHFAWDPRLHHVVRSLAIMALHEPRRADLPESLEPLVLDPEVEIAVQHDVPRNRAASDVDQMLLIAANLSQYARFSLAKAGFADAIDRKIAVLEARAREMLESYDYYQRNLQKGLRGALSDDDEAWLRFRLEDAMDLWFELGYHHQQLDHYDRAAAAYQRIVERPEHVLAQRWAHYNLACIRALGGDVDAALGELEAAVECGFSDLAWAARDGDLRSVHDDPRFLRLVAAARARRPVDPRPADERAGSDADRKDGAESGGAGDKDGR